MTDTQYAYAVAVIRAKEARLLSNAMIEQLMACNTYEAALSFLLEKGWGESSLAMDEDSVLNCEEKKTKDTLHELLKDAEILKAISYESIFHNLKAAIKELYVGNLNHNIYIEDTNPSPELVKNIVKNKEFHRLPKEMARAAEEAYLALMHTGDGQLCDVIIDRACMEAMYEAGRIVKEEVLKDYLRSQVQIGNIKVAVRCAKTGKDLDFIRRALSDCEDLNINALADAADKGVRAVCEYLSETGFKQAAEALEISYSAFELWCDNKSIQTLKPQKYNAFSVGPIIAYYVARQVEIKTVRIILSGKRNAISEELIRGKIREMYV